MSSPLFSLPCKRKFPDQDEDSSSSSSHSTFQEEPSSNAIGSNKRPCQQTQPEPQVKQDQDNSLKAAPRSTSRNANAFASSQTVTKVPVSASASTVTTSSLEHTSNNHRQPPPRRRSSGITNLLPSLLARTKSTPKATAKPKTSLRRSHSVDNFLARRGSITSDMIQETNRPLLKTAPPAPLPVAAATPAQQQQQQEKEEKEEASQPTHKDTTQQQQEPFEWEDIEVVDRVFLQASKLVALAYLTCLSVVYGILWDPQNSIGVDDTMERRVSQTAFFILLMAASMQLSPIVMTMIRRKNHTNHYNKNTTTAMTTTRNHRQPQVSGVLVAAMVIQSISLLTNALLGWGPSVIVWDPVTTSKVFLVRWCEWIPLSGLLTLLAESADVQHSSSSEKNRKHAWRGPLLFAATQAVSTVCGIILPYCQTTWQWIFVMMISCATFITIYPRTWARKEVFLKSHPGTSVLEGEHYERRRFAYYIMTMCCICWSVSMIIEHGRTTIDFIQN